MKLSAGILVFRKRDSKVEVLLVHPGGPFWAKKDLKAWSIPKGEFTDDEDPFTAAKREFKEELGSDAPEGKYIELGTVKTSSKLIHGWAVEGDFSNNSIKSNMIEIDWPPRSGQKLQIPEVDKAEWFEISKAAPKMHTGQDEFLKRLAEHFGSSLQESEQPSLF